MGILYPTFSSNSAKTTFSLNFGTKPYKFDFKKYAITEIDKTFQDINQIPIDKKTVVDLIMSYLYVHGSHGTLVSLETTFGSKRLSTIDKLRRCKTVSLYKGLESLSRSTSATTTLSDLESPDKRDIKHAGFIGSLASGFKKLLFSRDRKSMTMDEKQAQDLSSPELIESFSNHIEPSDETSFLERSSIRKEIILGRISEAENTFMMFFPALYQKSLAIQVIFKVLYFLDLFKNDQTHSLIYAKENFSGKTKYEMIQYVGVNRTIEYMDVKVIC